MAAPALKDLVAKPAALRLEKFKGEPLMLRPITVGDELWAEQTHGAEWMSKLAKGDLTVALGLVWQLLEDESRKLFKRQTVTVIDEMGEERERAMGGVALLMFCVAGKSEQVALYAALVDAMGLKVAAEEAASDFPAAVVQASAPAAAPTGLESSTH